MKHTAVIFDFDGVIANTMPDNYRAWSRAFAAQGVALNEREYFLLEGMNVREVAETLLKKKGGPPALAQAIADQKEAHYLAGHDFAFFPGVGEVLDRLTARFKLGLVSGAGLQRLRATVGSDFLDRFEAVIWAERVRHSKPHPEPYLTASEMLGAAPSRCLVVENAPLGVESAKNAGMDCIAVCSTLAPEDLNRADVIIDALTPAALSAAMASIDPAAIR